MKDRIFFEEGLIEIIYILFLTGQSGQALIVDTWLGHGPLLRVKVVEVPDIGACNEVIGEDGVYVFTVKDRSVFTTVVIDGRLQRMDTRVCIRAIFSNKKCFIRGIPLIASELFHDTVQVIAVPSPIHIPSKDHRYVHQAAFCIYAYT